MARKTADIDARLAEDIWMQLQGIADQCAKQQYFNALHRLADLQTDLLGRLQEITRDAMNKVEARDQ